MLYAEVVERSFSPEDELAAAADADCRAVAMERLPRPLLGRRAVRDRLEQASRPGGDEVRKSCGCRDPLLQGRSGYLLAHAGAARSGDVRGCNAHCVRRQQVDEGERRERGAEICAVFDELGWLGSRRNSAGPGGPAEAR